MMEKVLFDIDPYTFTGSAFVIGLLLAQELSTSEQDSVGNWLQLVGLVIQTYSSQVATLKSKDDKTNDNNDVETIKKAIQKMQEKLDQL